jgi:hypothetical protein
MIWCIFPQYASLGRHLRTRRFDGEEGPSMRPDAVRLPAGFNFEDPAVNITREDLLERGHNDNFEAV